jgi:hypothetical protein
MTAPTAKDGTPRHATTIPHDEHNITPPSLTQRVICLVVMLDLWRGVGRAVILPGRSMSGKTSLVAALVKAGATYFSDEYAVLDKLGMVHPYIKTLSLRTDSMQRLQRSAEELAAMPGGSLCPWRYWPPWSTSRRASGIRAGCLREKAARCLQNTVMARNSLHSRWKCCAPQCWARLPSKASAGTPMKPPHPCSRTWLHCLNSTFWKLCCQNAANCGKMRVRLRS